jgi:hypothetical protein
MSMDVGSWAPIGPVPIVAGGGRATGVLFSVAVAATDHRVIYAGSPTSGVWVTVDGGTSWRSASTGLPSLAVAAIAVDGSSPSAVLVAVAGERNLPVRGRRQYVEERGNSAGRLAGGDGPLGGPDECSCAPRQD